MDGAERPERRHVMHEVVHLSVLLIDRPKEVLMMPKAVGSRPLLIDEEIWLVDLRDLGQPTHPKADERPGLCNES